MSISHHPGTETRQGFLRGSIGPGASLVVACHLDLCPVCALEVEALHNVEGLSPHDLDGGAPGLPQALRLQSGQQPSWAPAALAGERIGRWRWAGPGLRLAWLRQAAGLGECLYVLKAKPGAKLPRHGHTGQERLVVLDGSFTDAGVVFSRGDMAEAGEPLEHQLMADRAKGCICLVATEGPVRLTGLGRFLQPFLGI